MASGGGAEPPQTNLEAWFESDFGITKDGSDYVSQWDDKTSNGNDLSMATGSYQPLWIDSEINGEPGISFDGTDDELATATFTSFSPATVYLVVKQDSWTDQDAIFDGATQNQQLIYQTPSSSKFRLYASGAGPISGDLGTSSYEIIVARFDSSSNALVQINDGTPVTGNVPSPAMTGIVLGNKGTGGSQTAYAGDVRFAAVLVYSEAHDSSEISDTLDYLNGKYATY